MRPFHIQHNEEALALTLSGTIKIIEKRSEDIVLIKQKFIFDCRNEFSLPIIRFASPIKMENGRRYEMKFRFDSSWKDATFMIKVDGKNAPVDLMYFGECIDDDDSSDDSSNDSSDISSDESSESDALY